MVSFRGILTAQGSPPSLAFIWMATLVATDIRPLGLLSTVLVTHWLGMGFSRQHFFLTAA
jgi:hypothetical protein